MGKLGWMAILLLVAAVTADQYLDHGYYTDSGLAMLREIGYSFH